MKRPTKISSLCHHAIVRMTPFLPDSLLHGKTTILLLPLLALSGCLNNTEATRYYTNPQKNIAAIGRVAIVELNNESSYPKVCDNIMESLYQAVQKKQLFGLTRIDKTDPAWRSLQLQVDATYSLEQLSAIRKTLKCNAVLIGTITQYQPYPRLTLGLRLRMLDLTDGQLIWALEQTWDTSDKTTEKRIKDYFNTQIRSGYEPLRQELVIISSLNFIKFVAYEVAQTLQPINRK